jgi:hypothetical protein
MSRLFTEDEDDFIRVATRNKIGPVQIARALGRSKEGVRYRQHVLFMQSPADSAPFTQEDDERLMSMRKVGTPWLDISLAFNRSLTVMQRRYKTLREQSREAEKQRVKSQIANKMERPIPGDPAFFPIQCQNHLVAILRADPRGFAAYTDTGNKKTALGIKLPLTYQGADQ